MPSGAIKNFKLEGNETDVTAYFRLNVNSHGSIRSAANDLGLSYYAVQTFLGKYIHGLLFGS